MGDHRKLPRLGKRKREVLLALHTHLGAVVEGDFPLGADEIPVKLYSCGVSVDQLLSSMSGMRHYLRPLDGMMLEVTSKEAKAEYARLYDEWHHRQWYSSVSDAWNSDQERDWRLAPLRELDVWLTDCGERSATGRSVLSSFEGWKERWGSLEAGCYSALGALERDRYIWCRRYKAENRVNKMMKIGLTMKGLGLARRLMEEAFSKYAVELREGFTRAGIPLSEHDKLVKSFRLKCGLVRPLPDV